jgi:hypothetical protein
MGAFEYPIQVTNLTVNASGRATWEWHNDFQAVSKRVIVRWNQNAFPQTYNDPSATTVADVSASVTSATTNRTSGYFAAFVQDNNNNWSAPAPDNVHRYHLESGGADSMVPLPPHGLKAR